MAMGVVSMSTFQETSLTLVYIVANRPGMPWTVQGFDLF